MGYDNVVLVISSEKPDGGCKTEIRLVSWNKEEPVLEKRQFTFDKVTREIMPVRVRGFTLKEFIRLVNFKDDIIKAWKESL